MKWKTIDDVLELAENTHERPSFPPGGIPEQRVPGWVRWPIRCLFLPFVLLDLFTQRVGKFIFKPPYKRVGYCKMRGNCCYYILMPAPKGVLSRIYHFWNTEINGFYPRSDEPLRVAGQHMTVMGCRYLKKDGSCGQYKLRPMICREWPRIEVFGPPQRLKGCGFRAVPRDPSTLLPEYPNDNKLNVID